MKKSKECMGELNGHAVGIVMKELVRRALTVIRTQRQTFQVFEKTGYTGKKDDVFTTADQAAQKVYLKSLRECFPTWGLIAEEDKLVVPCTDKSGYFFTVDPLCGTKAFVRGQSHGIGTMISLCREDEFIAAFVGDVNTQEIYGCRPGSRKVHRISDFSVDQTLKIKAKLLRDQYVMLRDPENRYCPLTRKYLATHEHKSMVIDGGSIGIWMARLWKREVGLAIVPVENLITPWDWNPVFAISLRLGFAFLRPNKAGDGWKRFIPTPMVTKSKRKQDIMIVHESNLHEVS